MCSLGEAGRQATDCWRCHDHGGGHHSKCGRKHCEATAAPCATWRTTGCIALAKLALLGAMCIGEPGAVRYGEALHPGPGSGADEHGIVREGAVAYRDPAQVGFWSAILPTVEDASPSHDQDYFALTIETVNGTAWGSMYSYLLTATAAHIILCQEHHLGPADIPAASAAALRIGWQSIFVPAAPGCGEGWRGGVAIFARRFIGLSPPRIGEYEVVPARALAVMAEAPGYRPFVAVSVYLEHGHGVDAVNLRHLEQVGAFLEMQGEHVPYVLGGDFQADPSDLARTGFARRSGGSLVASRSPRGTCRSSTATSELDFFYVHNSMTAGLNQVTVVEGAGTTPHLPVRLLFHPRLTSARTLVLRHPPRLEVERICGPLPPPPAWGDVQRSAAGLLARVRRQDFEVDDQFREEYARLFMSWADLAEVEVMEATGSIGAVKKTGLRGRAPVLVWRSVQSERPPRPTVQQEALSTWRTFNMIVQELRCTLYWLHPATDDERRRLRLCDGRQRGHAPVPIGMSTQVAPNLLLKLADIRCQLVEMQRVGFSQPANAISGTEHGQGEPLDEHGMAAALLALVGGAEAAVRASLLEGEEPRHGGTSPIVKRLTETADGIHRQAQQRSKELAAECKAARIESWRSWVGENIANGAKNAHRYLRLPEEWRPTTSITVDGVVSADPRNLLAAYAKKYDTLWNEAYRHRQERREQHRLVQSQVGQPARDTGQVQPHERPPWKRDRATPLQRPTPEELRAVSKTFRKDTLVAFDGFALRHYELMSDAALGIVADLIEILETCGELPSQLRLTEMPLIEKSRGGHRAVASLVGLYRLWAKLRKPMVAAWEARNERPYLAAGKGKRPHASVWQQACRAEAAVDSGGYAGNLLWDLGSFFESIKREPLWQRARRLEFPMTILKVALLAYESTRMLSMGGKLSAPLDAEDGILAGCGMAMALTRVYVIEPLDAAVATFGPRTLMPAKLDMYVDDVVLGAEGTIRQVINRLSHAASVLKEAIEGPLDCRIELDKASVISSSKPLTDLLRRKFGELAGPEGRAAVEAARREGHRHGCTRRVKRKDKGAAAVVNLGIDYAAGQTRRAQGVRTKRAKRLRRLGLKTAKLQRIRAIAGRRTPLIFMAGPLPEAVYGAAVNGLSDKEVLAIRRNAAQAFTPRARGRSLSKLLLLEGVPTWRAEVEVALEYAQQVWQASLVDPRTPCEDVLTLPQISQLWHSVRTTDILPGGGQRRDWSAVRGPIGAMWLSLHRIGWSMRNPFVMTRHDGEEIVLTTTSPAMLALLLKQAVQRTVQVQVGGKLAASDPRFVGRRAAAEHITAQLKSDRKLSAKDRACYKSVVCGAIMTNSRAAASGYIVEDVCPLCGERGDTILHRTWRCQHRDVCAARDAVVPRWLRDEFARADDVENNVFWTTGLIPHPAEEWPQPASSANMVYEWIGEAGPGLEDRAGDGQPRLQGSLYVDGSCTTNVFHELRRAATSVVQWSSARPEGWTLQMPVPSPLPQTPQAAEYCTMVLVRRFAHASRSMSVASDCLNVVRDMNMAPRLALASRRAYAGLIKEALTDEGWRRRCEVRKVPAHVDPSTLPAGSGRDDAVGNGRADVLAKEAVKAHPAPSPAQVQDLEATLKRAKYVVRAVAMTTQCFPPMPQERMRRPPPAREGQRLAVGNGHRWVYSSGLWRCEACLRMTTKAQLDAALAHEACPGSRASLDAAAVTARGHALAKTGGAVPLLFCVRCGAWSTRRAYGLSVACRGHPAPAGKQALKRIERGLQPWEDRRDRMEGRPRRGLRGFQMWSAEVGDYVGPTTSHAGADGGSPQARRRARRRDGPDGWQPDHDRRRRVEGHRDGDGDDDMLRGTDTSSGPHTVDDGGTDHGDEGRHGARRVRQRIGVGTDPSLADAVAQRVREHEEPGPSTPEEHMHIDLGERLTADDAEDGGPRDQEGHDGSTADDGQPQWQGPEPALRDDMIHDEVAITDVEASRGSTELGGGPGRGMGPAMSELSREVDQGRKRVKARSAHRSAVVAREGPGDAEPGCSTGAAAVPTAAAPVALGEAVTILTTQRNAPQHTAGGGEVTGPPNGAAAPLDNDSMAGAIAPRGQECRLSSQEGPASESGGRPRKRAKTNSPHTMRTRRRAGLRIGEAVAQGARDTPPGVERRRDGDDGPGGLPRAAWCGTAAAGESSLEQPRGGWDNRSCSGARKRECRENARGMNAENSATAADEGHSDSANRCGGAALANRMASESCSRDAHRGGGSSEDGRMAQGMRADSSGNAVGTSLAAPKAGESAPTDSEHSRVQRRGHDSSLTAECESRLEAAAALRGSAGGPHGQDVNRGPAQSGGAEPHEGEGQRDHGHDGVQRGQGSHRLEAAHGAGGSSRRCGQSDHWSEHASVTHESTDEDLQQRGGDSPCGDSPRDSHARSDGHDGRNDDCFEIKCPIGEIEGDCSAHRVASRGPHLRAAAYRPHVLRAAVRVGLPAVAAGGEARSGAENHAQGPRTHADSYQPPSNVSPLHDLDAMSLGGLAGAQRTEADSGAQQALGSQVSEQAMEQEGQASDQGWVPIWRRKPEWLYLPSQSGPLDDYAAKRRRVGSAADEADDRINGAAACSRGASRGVQLVEGEAADGGLCAPSIGGRGTSPGPRAGTWAGSIVAASAVAHAAGDGIRGHVDVPGAPGRGRPPTQQDILDASNAHIRRSLQDHAERVARRRAADGRPEQTSTAGERLRALRDRVAARIHASRGDGTQTPGNAAAGQVGERAVSHRSHHAGYSAAGSVDSLGMDPTSNEDGKIHPVRPACRIQDATAERTELSNLGNVGQNIEAARGAAGRQAVGPQAEGTPPRVAVDASANAARSSSDMVDAAHQVAWHSNLPRRDCTR